MLVDHKYSKKETYKTVSIANGCTPSILRCATEVRRKIEMIS